MAERTNPKSRNNELVVQKLGNEVLIYDLTNHKAFNLNETSALIWNLCDGHNSIDEISRQASGKLRQPVTQDLIYLALDQFKQDNLLADNESIEIEFNGLTRREVIRKVGLASMIALPVITGLVAPKAAHAASAAGLFATCATSANCGPGAPNCVAVGFGDQAGSQRCCVNGAGVNGTNGRPTTAAASCAACQSQATQGCCSGSSTLLSCDPIGPQFLCTVNCN